MNKNPFLAEAGAVVNKQESKLNLYSNMGDIDMLPIDGVTKLSKKEKSLQLMNVIKNRVLKLKDDTIKTVADPILSRTQNATTFLMAEKKSLLNESNSEIYQLLNLLSNKKPHVALKAATLIEKKFINPDCREVVRNYFKFNPDAKVKYSRLYNNLIKFDSAQ